MTNKLEANRAFYILCLISAVGLFMLLSLLSKIAPLTISHAVYYCQKTLSNIIFTLPHFAPPLVALVFISIILMGLSLLAIQFFKTRLFIKKMLKAKVATPVKVTKIARQLGLVNRINVVRLEPLSSFCYGLINPRICLSLKLVKTLSESELKAVLIHESYHFKNRDPLKILLSQIAVSMFFFIPTLKDFHNYYVLSKEIAADQLAIQFKSIKDLKSALAKVLTTPSPVLAGVASFGSDYLEQRIKVLTAAKNVSIKISPLNLLVSFTVFVFALVALNMPVYAIENGEDNHAYFVCPYGGECMLSCASQGVMKEAPFTPANYTPTTSY